MGGALYVCIYTIIIQLFRSLRFMFSSGLISAPRSTWMIARWILKIESGTILCDLLGVQTEPLFSLLTPAKRLLEDRAV